MHGLFLLWWGGPLLALLIFVAYFLLGQIVPAIAIGVLLFAQGGLSGGGPPSQAELETQMAPYVPMIVISGVLAAALIWGALHLLRWSPPAPDLGQRLRERLGARAKLLWFPGCVLVLTAVTLGGQILLSQLLNKAGAPAEEQQLLVQAAASGGALFYLSVALFAPIGEEIVFRRLMFGVTAQSSGRIAAYVLTSLLFALVHLNFAAFPLYLYMAICYALAYELTGSVWGAASVHALNNTVALLGLS